MNKDNKPMILHKSNIMVKAKYNLTTLETRLYLNILYCLQSKIRNNECNLIDTHKNTVSLEMKKESFEELIPGKQYLEDAKFIRLFEGLRTKPIYYKIDKKWTLSGFIDRATIDSENQSIIKIELDIFTLKMLTSYKEDGYTPLNLALTFGLEGMYSYRLYELIRLWSNTKKVINYSIDELKEYLMLEDKKSYNTYANFKNKVIKPAVEELNVLGLFHIEYSENKVGRKVDSIDFIVKDLDKRKYFTKEEVVVNTSSTVIEEVASTTYSVDNNATDKNIFKPTFNNLNENINEAKECNFEPFVLDETLFTKGTLRSFKKDFRGIDFKNKYMEKAFDDAVMVVLDRDDVDT
ncbi:MAG: replication initiation protein, partial [Romboutsia sp.]|uniref:replication initiation protein n=1 Tax=Romboutsia sp. TaxID=1965302 RepID=UPI003F358ADC